MIVQAHTKGNKQAFVSLQILRALAAVSVVYLHLATQLPFGSFGVDIFFVLSGFVMAMVVDRGELPREFAINRISRIVPLYWLLTTGVLLLAILKPALLNSTTASLENYLKSILFIPYHKENGVMQPMLLVGWSLNYEVFFYGCIWLALIFFKRKALEVAAVCIGIVYFVAEKSSGKGVLCEFFDNEMVFEFVFGLVAYKIIRSRPALVSPKAALAIAVVVFVFMVLTEVVNKDVVNDRLIFFGIPSFILVMAAITAEKLFHAGKSKAISFFVLIGNASYAIYLSHFYVIMGFKKLVFEKIYLFSIPQNCIMFLAAISAGIVIYQIVDEKSHRFMRQKLMRIKWGYSASRFHC